MLVPRRSARQFNSLLHVHSLLSLGFNNRKRHASPISPTTASRCRPPRRRRPRRQGSEVLLRVSHCGVCHSDLHLQDGYFDLGGGQKLDVRGNRPCPSRWATRSPAPSRRRGPRRRASPRASATPPIPGSAAASAGCARAATSTCAMRPACSASPSTAAMPPMCWCRIRAICSTSRASRPEIAGAADVLRASPATAPSRRPLPYLRAGPADDRRPRRRRHDGPAVRPRADGQADPGGRHRRRPSARRPSSSARRRPSTRPMRARARRSARHRGGGVGAAVDFAGSDKSLGFAHGAGGQGRRGHRRRPDRRQLLHAGADVSPARAHHHGQLRRLARGGARDAGPGQGRQGGADPGRAARRSDQASASLDDLARRQRSSAAWSSRRDAARPQ